MKEFSFLSTQIYTTFFDISCGVLVVHVLRVGILTKKHHRILLNIRETWYFKQKTLLILRGRLHERWNDIAPITNLVTPLFFERLHGYFISGCLHDNFKPKNIWYRYRGRNHIFFSVISCKHLQRFLRTPKSDEFRSGRYHTHVNGLWLFYK